MKENDSLTSQWESSVKESASNDSIDDSLVTLTAMDSRSFLEDAADLMSNIVTLQPVSVNLGIVSRDFQGVRELPSAWVPALAWFVAGAEPPNLENLPQEAAGRCLSCAREKGLMVGAQSIKPLTPLDIEALFIKNEWSGIKPRNHAVLFCLPPISGIVLPGAVLFDINDRISVDALFETLGNMMESGFPIEAGAVSVMASHAIDSLEEEVDELVASVAIKLRHKNWRREPIDQLALLVRQMSEDLDRIYRSVASFLVDLTALRGSSLNTIQLSHCARDWAFQTRSPPCHQVCQFRADTLLALDAVSARASRFRQTLLLTRAKTFHLNATIAQELAQQLDHIIWFEALFSATNSAVAIGFLVFGLYGMNFRNGFEESWTAFTTVWVSATSLGLFVLGGMSAYITSNRVH